MVVAGWSLHYVLLSLQGAFKGLDGASSGALFGDFLASPSLVLGYATLFLVATMFCLGKGIEKGIANSIPANFQTIIIFEYWDKNFNSDKILDYFNGRAELFKIKTDVPWKKSWPKAIKLLSFIIKGKFKTKASKNNIESWIGDLILTVNSK